MYVDLTFCLGLWCEPAFYWQWTQVEADSGALVLVAGGGRAAFAHHGGLGPGSSLHGEILYSDDGYISGYEYWGLFRPKSSDPWPEFEKPVDVNQEDDPCCQRPEAVHLMTYPNPFNSTVSIRYTIPTSGSVTFDVYSVTGQLVARVVRENLSVGVHTVTWDGTDAAGRAAASGVYVVRLEYAPVGRSGGVRRANSQTNSNEVRVRRVTLIR